MMVIIIIYCCCIGYQDLIQPASNFNLTHNSNSNISESCLMFRTNDNNAVQYNRTHIVALVQQNPDGTEIFMNKVTTIFFIDDDSKL